jgi:predicted AlkP superfamily phosphohydrolase/phosphomutase
LESRARFGAIDMTQTLAFSDELNYFPAIHWNLRGREPEGTLDAHDVPATQAAITEALLALRDPWSGTPVVAAVHAREAVFHGPFVERAPDLLLELSLDDGYSYNLMPSPIDGATRDAWRRLHAHEHLGRKGRSLAGSHRAHGVFIAAGPRVSAHGRIEIRIADVTTSLLNRINGRSTSSDTPRLATRVTPTANVQPGSGEAIIEARLRALGYVE